MECSGAAALPDEQQERAAWGVQWLVAVRTHISALLDEQ